MGTRRLVWWLSSQLAGPVGWTPAGAVSRTHRVRQAWRLPVPSVGPCCPLLITPAGCAPPWTSGGSVPCGTCDGVSDLGLCVAESTPSLTHLLGCWEPPLSLKPWGRRLRMSQAPGLCAVEGCCSQTCPRQCLVIRLYQVRSSGDFWLEGRPEFCYRASLVGCVCLPSFLPFLL